MPRPFLLPPPGADLAALQARWASSNKYVPLDAVQADWDAILKENRIDLADRVLAWFPTDQPDDQPTVSRRHLMVGYLTLLAESAQAGHAAITLRLLAAIETHTFPGWTSPEAWHREAIEDALRQGHTHVVVQVLAAADPERCAVLCAHPLKRGDANQFDTLVRLAPAPLTEAQWDQCAHALATHDRTPDTPHVYLGLLERFQPRLARIDLVPWLVGNLGGHEERDSAGDLWTVPPNVPALARLLGPLPPATRDLLLAEASPRLEPADRALLDTTLAALAGPLRAWDRQKELQHHPISRSSARPRA